MTDAELVARFLAGDVGAFNTLVRRWERPAYNFILRYAGNREEARDLCQKTFIRVHKNLRRLRDREKFSTWFYQVALNTCRDAARSRQRHPTCSLDGMEEVDLGTVSEMVSSSIQPDAVAHNLGVRELLNRALQAIPEEQRVVVVMKEYQGLKFVEIAEVLEVPLNTVKSRMYYGLNALRKLFEQWQIDEEMVRYDV
ncbi:MAG: sigma-70 family RNA polymerase sigma factor [bacterium]|nr:sigma-70 family RNA polymerase sigma factor [bacterium]